MVAAYHARMTDNAHDPGSDRSSARVKDLPQDVAAEPIHSRRRRGHGRRPDRDRVVDRPDDDRGRRLLPDGADSAEERLAYYASRFPLVEVDATYYALPARRTAELWVERTPPDFTFDIKAHALMTGQPTETKRLPKDLREALPEEIAAKPRIYAKDLPDELADDVWAWFADALEPLKEAGQLGSILLQYPRWFFTSSENRDQIEEATGRLREAGMTGAVEFRSASWFNEKNIERTLKFLGDRRSRWSSSTSRRASSRACRRRRGDLAGPRDRALPRSADRDLGGEGHPGRRALPLPVRPRRARGMGAARPETAGQAKDTHVLFNNCYANYGATNALELAQLLLDLEAADALVVRLAGPERQTRPRPRIHVIVAPPTQIVPSGSWLM